MLWLFAISSFLVLHCSTQCVSGNLKTLNISVRSEDIPNLTMFVNNTKGKTYDSFDMLPLQTTKRLIIYSDTIYDNLIGSMTLMSPYFGTLRVNWTIGYASWWTAEYNQSGLIKKTKGGQIDGQEKNIECGEHICTIFWVGSSNIIGHLHIRFDQDRPISDPYDSALPYFIQAQGTNLRIDSYTMNLRLPLKGSQSLYQAWYFNEYAEKKYYIENIGFTLTKKLSYNAFGDLTLSYTSQGFELIPDDDDFFLIKSTDISTYDGYLYAEDLLELGSVRLENNVPYEAKTRWRFEVATDFIE